MTDNQDLLAMTHVGEDPHKYMKSVTPPVFMNSLHVFDTVKDYFDVDIFNDEFYYGRASNPTVAILEKKIAALEHGSRAVVFSAGMAACAAAILRVCTAGSNVICIKESYGPVQHLLDEFLGPKYNVSVTYVDGRTVKEFEDAIRPETKMIILESPTTLLFNVVDLEGVAKLAKEHGIKTYIDNTYSTPLFQKPLDMGIDIVMHTMTKYIGGHSDLVGGVLVSKDEQLMRDLMVQRDWFGGVMGLWKHGLRSAVFVLWTYVCRDIMRQQWKLQNSLKNSQKLNVYSLQDFRHTHSTNLQENSRRVNVV